MTLPVSGVSRLSNLAPSIIFDRFQFDHLQINGNRLSQTKQVTCKLTPVMKNPYRKVYCHSKVNK